MEARLAMSLSNCRDNLAVEPLQNPNSLRAHFVSCPPMNPRTKLAPRDRLERALCKENYFYMAWSNEREIDMWSGPEYEAWVKTENRHGGKYIDERGTPYPEVVVSLEAYVKALTSQTGPIERELNDQLGIGTPAQKAFASMVAKGGNALWIAGDCFGIRRGRKPRRHDKRDLDHVDRQLKTLANQLDDAGDRLKKLLERASAIGLRLRMDRTLDALLGRQAASLRAQGMRWRNSGRHQTKWSDRVLEVSAHLLLTTGQSHDRLVCDLAKAVAPPGRPAITTGGLQVLRSRAKLRGEWPPFNHGREVLKIHAEQWAMEAG
jgi:hypothetical protein